jgi:tagatose 6-phosphate kinase
MLAGFAVAQQNGESVADALKLGVACGAANAASHFPAQFEQKTVEELLPRVETKEVA